MVTCKTLKYGSFEGREFQPISINLKNTVPWVLVNWNTFIGN